LDIILLQGNPPHNEARRSRREEKYARRISVVDPTTDAASAVAEPLPTEMLDAVTK
jgi:hypothetical protein